MSDYHIAALDIGKTNKKILVYDQDLQIVAEKVTTIDEYTEDGVNRDDVEKVEKWLVGTLGELSGDYDIRALSVSGHGATFTCVDGEGNLAVPEVSYTTDPGEQFHADFYKEFGSIEDLQVETGTPNFNLLLNIAKGIWWARNRYPEQFARTKYILNYPQYWGYRFTGNVGAEYTYTGCHGYLWNPKKNDWSSVVDRMGIRELMPKKMSLPNESLGVIKPEMATATGLGENTIMTMGIHDSNAALLPYLITRSDDFILDSTGTWCVIMRQGEEVKFNDDELGKVVFFNISAFGKPVKTAIFLGGMEFEQYNNILQKINGADGFPPFNRETLQRIVSEKELFILPQIAEGTGQFPDSSPRIVENGRVYDYSDVEDGKEVPEFFKDYETAYLVLNLSLAVQTKVSLDRAGAYDGIDIFVEGGFRNNEHYNNILDAFYPGSQVSLTNLEEASAFGAAFLGKSAVEGRPLEKLGGGLEIEMKPVGGVEVEGLEDYFMKFLSLL